MELLLSEDGMHKYKVCDDKVQSWVYYRLMEIYWKVCHRQYCRVLEDGYVPVMKEHRSTLSKRLRDYNHWRITNG
jgi:hypothetical protein